MDSGKGYDIRKKRPAFGGTRKRRARVDCAEVPDPEIAEATSSHLGIVSFLPVHSGYQVCHLYPEDMPEESKRCS